MQYLSYDCDLRHVDLNEKKSKKVLKRSTADIVTPNRLLGQTGQTTLAIDYV